MGEVYRADDLKLGQPVALKFLPRTLEKNQARLGRFLNEVKLARQVSHPNVCRVYDVGETDPSRASGQGQHFISMEYVDGEDLSSLLRRIGRLPRDKAIQMARQLCAGLAAAHEQGILHRDLKPANVMIDGRGRAKITDFGLAGLTESIDQKDLQAGTPGYMAPEQLAGKEVSVRSDVYSLGLVLYELFTGKRAFEANTLAELTQMHKHTSLTSPSTLVDGFDPAVERVILRCMEKDPADRPGSALAVAAALPGGDPLAAALAAGETPSPELVAAAGEKAGLKPWIAWACLGLVALGLPATVLLSDHVMLFRQVPLDQPPQVLRAKAQTLIGDLGFAEPPVDTAQGFAYDMSYLAFLQQTAPREDWSQRLAEPPPAVTYWYRQSPEKLLRFNPLASRATPSNPPPIRPGMAQVDSDTRGQLIRFARVPTDGEATLAEADSFDWSRLFDAAGLDKGSFTPVEPVFVPPVYANERGAWEGSYPNRPEIPLRVEAAALGGRPVLFRVVRSWEESEDAPGSDGLGALFIVFVFVVLGLFTTACLMARWNVRRGRGDRRGAFRLAVYFFSIQFLAWIFGASHVAALEEIGYIVLAVAMNMFAATLIWIVYLALEPFVRRRWPDTLVSWTRLLDGRFKDPLVGRDLLLGAAFAMAMVLFDDIMYFSPNWIGLQVQYQTPPLDVLLGGRLAIMQLLAWQGTIWIAMISLLTIVIFRVLLRRTWAAFILTLLVISVWTAFATGATGIQAGGIQFVFALLFWAVYLMLLMRFGLLAAIVALYVHAPLAHGATTGNLGAWYSEFTIGAVLLVLAVAVYGFYVSFAGRPLLGEHAFED